MKFLNKDIDNYLANLVNKYTLESNEKCKIIVGGSLVKQYDG